MSTTVNITETGQTTGTAVATRNGDDGRTPGTAAAKRQTSYLRLLLQLLLPLAVLTAGYGIFAYLKATKPEVAKHKPRPQIFNVASAPVVIGDQSPMLRLYGSTVAGRQVDLRSLVAGRVVKTSDALRVGGQVAIGDELLRIDPFDFKTTIDETEAQIAEARARIREMKASIEVEEGNLKFGREQLQLAERDLERAEPLSKRGALPERAVDDRRVILVQRRQSVAQSENNVTVWNARIAQQEATIKRLESNLARARQRLAETQLSAPFNAYVSAVDAQIGRMLSVNDRVATLIDRDRIDVDFTLTDEQFGRLARPPGGLKDREIEINWRLGNEVLKFQGVIDRIGATVSSGDGGVRVFARVLQPAKGIGLRPGAFVEINVPDTKFTNVARLPSAAIFDGKAVFAIENGTLKRRSISIVGVAGADVLVQGDLKTGDRVLLTRLSTPGDGVRVRDVSSGKSKPSSDQRTGQPRTQDGDPERQRADRGPKGGAHGG